MWIIILHWWQCWLVPGMFRQITELIAKNIIFKYTHEHRIRKTIKTILFTTTCSGIKPGTRNNLPRFGLGRTRYPPECCRPLTRYSFHDIAAWMSASCKARNTTNVLLISKQYLTCLARATADSNAELLAIELSAMIKKKWRCGKRTRAWMGISAVHACDWLRILH